MSEIIPFPLYRRVSVVREIADRIETLHGPAANSYWRERIAIVVSQLKKMGVDNDAIRTEVLSLQDAVQTRIRDQSMARQG
ncbi:hypothetical protein JYU29_11110 [Tianweitania sp. BSSL-BM11]|uniref:Uncharacterized protein n=1 Tax=Tianweitania aestuarii TaxID=2814886 RepID=A0ABS5RVY9_9HYPH|nr:DUF6074 family protein [Tianweitania aestuarii]MBS9721236.1 hypothetical protein [Tianweitania aestuarii]